MAKGKFKHKPTGERSPEEIAAGTSAGRPRTFNKIGKTTDISRREREELEKQKSHDSRMKCQEQGKTEQARKVLESLTLIPQQRAEAAKKREEEKADMESASRADNALLNEKKGKNKMDYKSLQNEAESLRTKLQHVDSKSAQVDLLHGSDDKSNPDVVALEQTKLSGREDQTGSS